jgi:hypothetical protein
LPIGIEQAGSGASFMKSKFCSRFRILLIIVLLLGLIPQTVVAQSTEAAAGGSSIYLPLVANASTHQSAQASNLLQPSGARIELSLLGVILPGIGEWDSVGATIYDANGIALSDAVTWSENDPNNVVELIHGVNEVKLHAIGIGSAMVMATYDGLQRSVSVTVAPAHAHTRKIAHPLVRYDLSTPTTIFLTNAFNLSTIQIGDIVVSNPVQAGQAGFLLRVTEVIQHPDLVQVNGTPAAIHEAFTEFHVNAIGDPIHVRPRYPDGVNAALAGESTGIPFERWCTGEYTSSVAIEISLLQFSEEPFVLTPHVEAGWDWQGVSYARLTYEVATDLTLTGPTVSAALQGRIAFECEIELETVIFPPIPVSIPGLFVAPRITPAIGLRGELTLTGSVTLQTVELTFSAQSVYGVEYYRDGNTWQQINETGTPTLEVTGPKITSEPLTLDASLTPFLSGVFGMQFFVGTFPVLSLDLVKTELSLTGTINVPALALLDAPHPLHVNPSWRVDAGITFDLALEVGTPLLPPPYDTFTLPEDFNFNLYENTETVGQSPGFNIATTVVGTGRTITVTPRGSFGWLERLVYAGESVELWAMPQGIEPFLIDSSVLDAEGRAVFTQWTPQGTPVCTVNLPSPSSRFALPCTFVSNENRHWYGLHVVVGPSNTQAALAVHLRETPSSPAIAISFTPNTGGDCRTYPHPLRGTSATTLHAWVINYGRMAGTFTVEDYGTEPLSNYQIVAVVHDRIFNLVGLEHQTDPVFAPPLVNNYCLPR